MNKPLKQGLIVGTICLLMLVAIPMGTADDVHPKAKGGPYFVYLAGICFAGDFADPIMFDRGLGIQIGPLGWYKLPFGPKYVMEKGSIFIVNGKVQNITYPADIWFPGFKGWAPATILWLGKILIHGKIRVFGVCPEYSVYHPLLN